MSYIVMSYIVMSTVVMGKHIRHPELVSGTLLT